MAPKAKRKLQPVSSKTRREKTPLRQSSRVKKTQLPLKPRRKSTSKESKKDREPSSDNDSGSDFEKQKTENTDSDAEGNNETKSYSVPFPKAREAGDTPYANDRIHPNTLLFLKELKANNNRDWLKWNDKIFRQALTDWESFVEMLGNLVRSMDPTVPELPKKDIIFRIYRDIRFSNDPTPYKPHFSAAWSRTGKKGPYAAYYVQIQPGGENFVGGGLWNPDSPALATIREDIDQNSTGMKQALMNEILAKTFFPTVKLNEKDVVAAFVARNSENALKSKPRGYHANHKDIELLRLRNFTMGKKLTDAEVVAPTGIRKIADVFRGLVPWITYLNSVVMPDPVLDADDTGDSDQG